MSNNFERLLASSSQTLSSTHSIKLSGPALKRSLHELSAACNDLGSVNSIENEISAHRLLAREGGGFDATKLWSSCHLASIGSVYARKQNNSIWDTNSSGNNIDLPKSLNKRRDETLALVLTTQRRATYESSKKAINKRIETIHDNENENLLKDLAGFRVPMYSSTKSREYIINPSEMDADNNRVIQNSDLLLLDQQVEDTKEDFGSNTKKIYFNEHPTISGFGPKLSESFLTHSSIVSSLNINSQKYCSGSEFFYTKCIQGFCDQLYAAVSQIHAGSSTSENTAYMNSIKLLQYVIRHDSLNNNHSSGSNKLPMERQNLRVKRRAGGTLAYLCHQFRCHVVDRVRSAALNGVSFQMSGPSSSYVGFAKDVASFVEIDLGISSNDATASFWPQLYYCLRCGEWEAALEIVQRNQNTINYDDIDFSSLSSCISPFVEDSNDSLWKISKWNGSIDVAGMAGSRKRIKENYQKIKDAFSNDNSESLDCYKMAVLGLLSTAEAMPLNVKLKRILSTLEDYLFSMLWDAVQADDDNKVSCLDKVSQLGKLIKSWGPTYFESESNASGWGYVTPLLVAQQYHSAIDHLANFASSRNIEQRKNGLIAPTHLALVLDVAGIPFYDCESKEMQGQGQTKLLSTLLITYSKLFQDIDPEVALSYLIRIPGTGGKISNEATDNIVRLIVETRSFDILAGRVSTDGSRVSSLKQGKGALDAYFSSKEVSTLLSRAAKLISEKGDLKGAAELLALAGRFSDLISVINNELGLLLFVQNEEKNQEREFWKSVSHKFYSVYLANGRTYVQEVLEAEENLSLLTNLRLLMNLMEFFDFCKRKKWEDAWFVIEQLELIPRSEQDILFCVESYRLMHSSIKQSFHHIALAAMEALSEMHATTKGSAMIRSDEKRICELKNKARFLITFLGLIQIPHAQDVHHRIARMEAFMI